MNFKTNAYFQELIKKGKPMPEGMSFSLSRRVHQLLEDVQLVKRTSFHMYKFPSDKCGSSICSFFFFTAKP